MRKFKNLTVVTFALLAILALVSATTAQAREPKYLHALSDLRTARWLIKWQGNNYPAPGTAQATEAIIGHLDKAIELITQAALEDGKNPWHEPSPESAADRTWALHSADRLIHEARHDIEEGQDNPQNAGLQIRSLEHLDRALFFLGSWINSGKGQ